MEAITVKEREYLRDLAKKQQESAGYKIMETT